MQRMKKLGVMTNSSPLLTLNAEGENGMFLFKKRDCCRNSTIFPPGLHTRCNRIDCVFLALV